MATVAKTVMNLAPLLTYEWIGLDNYTNAVCNDGSPAGYYWKESPVKDADTWLVYLGSGNWCFNRSDCQARCPPEYLRNNLSFMGDFLCTSRTMPPTLELGGVLAPTSTGSPAIANAHKAFVTYCSSDGHMGDGEAFGMQFRGARIVEAVFQDLVRRRGLAARRVPSVIFGGVSAGARGAMVLLDYVGQMIREADGARYDAKVFGLLDSPLWIDTPPMAKSGFNGFRHSCRSVREFANVTHLGWRCAQAFPEHQRFKCLMGEYRMKYLDTPYFMIASQYDSFQLMLNVGAEASGDEEETRYMEDFGARTVEYVGSLANNMGLAQAVFSPACFSHARTMTPEGWSLEGLEFPHAGRKTVEETFGSWYDRAQANGTFFDKWVEECEGVGCGKHCPVDPALEVEPDRAFAARRSGGSWAFALAFSWLAALARAFPAGDLVGPRPTAVCSKSGRSGARA